MNTRYLKTLLTAAAALLGSACIENDVPYPVVEISIADIEGEGFTVGATDPANRTITLALDEQTVIRAVAKQATEARKVLRCRDQKNIPEPRQHQNRQRIIDHRLVVNG